VGKGKEAPWRKILPEEYKSDERLDGAWDICKFLGISHAKFYQKIAPEMREAGVLFRRKHRQGRHKVRSQLFTYKRLVLAWLIKGGQI
jgi:hypothetical protein